MDYMDRREFLRAAAIGASALSLPAALARQDKSTTFEELPREQVDAIDKGLRWRAKNQYSTGGIRPTCQDAYTPRAGPASPATNSTPPPRPYAQYHRDAPHVLL